MRWLDEVRYTFLCKRACRRYRFVHTACRRAERSGKLLRAEAAYLSAVLALSQGRFFDASVQFRHALHYNPKHGVAKLGLAYTLERCVEVYMRDNDLVVFGLGRKVFLRVAGQCVDVVQYKIDVPL